MKPISTVPKNTAKLLADITYALKKSKINIDSLDIEVEGEKTIVSVCLSDILKGTRIIEAAGYRVEGVEGIVRISNISG